MNGSCGPDGGLIISRPVRLTLNAGNVHVVTVLIARELGATPPQIGVLPASETSHWTSEEVDRPGDSDVEETKDPIQCPPNLAMTGLTCDANYCDNVQLTCTACPGVSTQNHRFTGFFSEGDGYQGCNSNEFASGIACRGDFCDDIRWEPQDFGAFFDRIGWNRQRAQIDPARIRLYAASGDLFRTGTRRRPGGALGRRADRLRRATQPYVACSWATDTVMVRDGNDAEGPTMDTSATCRLPDGRTLGYATWGDPSGLPTIVCHGLPGSRFCGTYLDAPAQAAGVRLITPERPGFGLSSRSAPRVLTQWPHDVEALADHLELPTFHLLGVSGGGPHALACAALIPKRLRSVKVVVSLGPLDAPEATTQMDPVLRRLWLSGPRLQRFGSRMTGLAARFLPDSALIPTRDEHARRFFEQPQIREAFMREIREAVRDGGRAMADEVAMLSHDWGFSLSDISIPVRLWAGEEDRNCPVGMTRYLISQIPDVDATIFPGEGHMCAFERLDQLFELDRPASTPDGTNDRA